MILMLEMCTSSFIILIACKTFEVISIDHWRDGETGQYFEISQKDYDSIYGGHNKKWTVTQFARNKSVKWTGQVVMFYTYFDVHGRRVNGFGQEQWAKGDKVQFCDY